MRILIGLFLIIFLSPLTVWFAESQHRAKDFSSAKQVDATSEASGYIRTVGPAASAEPIICPSQAALTSMKPCAYVRTLTERYTRTETIECGELPSDRRVITQVEDRCENGTCESCYQVETLAWVEVSDETEYAVLTIGRYEVHPNDSTKFVGTRTQEFTHEKESDERDASNTNPIEGDQRITYSYLEIAPEMLVAGDATSNVIRSAERIFVLSPYGHDETLAALDAEDKGTALGFRIFSLILMMLGFALLATGISSIFTGGLKFVPFLGKSVHGMATTAVGILAALVGAAAWLIVWIVVLLLKNIFLIFGTLLVIGILLAIFLTKKAKLLEIPIINSITK